MGKLILAKQSQLWLSFFQSQSQNFNYGQNTLHFQPVVLLSFKIFLVGKQKSDKFGTSDWNFGKQPETSIARGQSK